VATRSASATRRRNSAASITATAAVCAATADCTAVKLPEASAAIAELLDDAGIAVDDDLIVTVDWGGTEGADAMAKLNEQFLGKSGPTDVLSFPMEEEPGPTGRSPDFGGTHFLHGYQVRRNASGLLEQADRAEQEKEPIKALEYLSRYVGLVPADADDGSGGAADDETSQLTAIEGQLRAALRRLQRLRAGDARRPRSGDA